MILTKKYLSSELIKWVQLEKESIKTYEAIVVSGKIRDTDKWFYREMIKSSKESIKTYLKFLRNYGKERNA